MLEIAFNTTNAPEMFENACLPLKATPTHGAFGSKRKPTAGARLCSDVGVVGRSHRRRCHSSPLRTSGTFQMVRALTRSESSTNVWSDMKIVL